jgi:hypothetical protein
MRFWSAERRELWMQDTRQSPPEYALPAQSECKYRAAEVMTTADTRSVTNSIRTFCFVEATGASRIVQSRVTLVTH